MKKIIALFIISVPFASFAGCPTGYEEIQMENITMTDATAQCSADTMAYYQIDELCDANIIPADAAQ